MGPPGSGKSYIGNSLATEKIASYLELEPLLVEKFGKGAEFLSNKDAALRFIRESYSEQLQHARGPVAFESTGVSDRALIESLRREYQFLLVKVETPRDTCVARVASRPGHLNIGNDVAASARFYDFWYRDIEPTYRFAASVDGTNVDAAVRDIANLLSRAATEANADSCGRRISPDPTRKVEPGL
jgi:gluconate kinase